MIPDADYASLSWRERMAWINRPKKFCGRLTKHDPHGWICGRTPVRCAGARPAEERKEVTGGDPIELVQDLARGAYRPRTSKRTR